MSSRATSLLLVGLCVLAAGCSGGGDDPAGPEPSGPLAVSVSNILVDYYDAGGEFAVRNTGDASLSWTASSNRTWLQLSDVSGDLDGGAEVPITMTIDRTGLSTGVHSARVTVNSDGSDSRRVDVSLRNYDEDIIIVDFTILDAEYDINNERWVAISKDPSQLHVIDAVDKTIESVALSVEPQCVSVRPDGAYAAVGHNAWITRVNLNSVAAATPTQITTDANDVVLAQNDFVYVFPKGSGWDNLRTIGPTGNETVDPELIYPGMIARLHPSENSIYAADNGISPSDVEKFDISSGSAVYQYDSPYHGDYAFSGNLWFSNDGSKFVARSRYVFHASPDSLSDMVYAGALSVNRIVEWAVQSTTNDKWYVSHTNWLDEVSNEVNIYDGSFFQFESFVTVPNVPNTTHVGPLQFPAVGARYIAVNSAGTALHVIGRRLDDNVWAVASIALTP